MVLKPLEYKVVLVKDYRYPNEVLFKTVFNMWNMTLLEYDVKCDLHEPNTLVLRTLRKNVILLRIALQSLDHEPYFILALLKALSSHTILGIKRRVLGYPFSEILSSSGYIFKKLALPPSPKPILVSETPMIISNSLSLSNPLHLVINEVIKRAKSILPLNELNLLSKLSNNIHLRRASLNIHNLAGNYYLVKGRICLSCRGDFPLRLFSTILSLGIGERAHLGNGLWIPVNWGYKRT